MSDNGHTAIAFKTWMLTLAYDGADFHGWQVQPGQATIQGELQAALGRVTGETPLPQGSGRTDAGVHALAQVASFPLRAPIPAHNLLRALNRTLPPAIRILSAQIAPEGFHARHSALAKTYEYRIFIERDDTPAICPPFLARYVYPCQWSLAIDALNRAAAHFLGEHNFLSFAATDPDLAARSLMVQSHPPAPQADPAATAIRTIFFSHWERRTIEEADLLVYRVRGNGFLHHMVRNLVGVMVDVGRGAISADAIPAILNARNRAAAGPTAPACGLFLHSVEYRHPQGPGVVTP